MTKFVPYCHQDPIAHFLSPFYDGPSNYLSSSKRPKEQETGSLGYRFKRLQGHGILTLGLSTTSSIKNLTGYYISGRRAVYTSSPGSCLEVVIDGSGLLVPTTSSRNRKGQREKYFQNNNLINNSRDFIQGPDLDKIRFQRVRSDRHVGSLNLVSTAKPHLSYIIVMNWTVPENNISIFRTK